MTGFTTPFGVTQGVPPVPPVPPGAGGRIAKTTTERAVVGKVHGWKCEKISAMENFLVELTITIPVSYLISCSAEATVSSVNGG